MLDTLESFGKPDVDGGADDSSSSSGEEALSLGARREPTLQQRASRRLKVMRERIESTVLCGLSYLDSRSVG